MICGAIHYEKMALMISDNAEYVGVQLFLICLGNSFHGIWSQIQCDEVILFCSYFCKVTKYHVPVQIISTATSGAVCQYSGFPEAQVPPVNKIYDLRSFRWIFHVFI